MNAEFQKIARRDKKAFLSDQCKETEENNRMGKTRDLFKKIRYTKGTFHAKMGLIKDILSLLQRIFPTQESNQGLLHCRRILCQLSSEGSPLYTAKYTKAQPLVEDAGT